jgi:MerR family transcriptional regulator, heat shock protein HspR
VTRRTVTTTKIENNRGVFMISVAAELAEMHPQTLRMYEARGLIEPKRSPKNTRLYSQADVERLRRIQEMTTGMGLNLAGVETVLELEERLDQMRAELEAMQARLRESLGGEMVPYGAYDPPRDAPAERKQIPISRPRKT